MMKCTLFLFVLFVNWSHVTAQKCDTIDRALFHMLPAEVPDIVNCLDGLGQRIGWGIEYEILYREKRNGDGPIGYYVPNYYYGQYQNGRKIGTWTNISNVHLITPCWADSFAYSKDTVLIYSSNFFQGKTQLKYLSDSSFISSRKIQYSRVNGLDDTVSIFCRKAKDVCRIYYKGAAIRTFKFDQFDIAWDCIWILVDQERERTRFKAK